MNFHSGYFRLILAAGTAKDFAAVTTMVFTFVNGELDTAVDTGFSHLVSDPMIHHAFADRSGRNRPGEDTTLFVANVDGLVVFADSQRRDGGRTCIVRPFEGRMHGQLGPENELLLPHVTVFSLPSPTPPTT